MSDGNLLFIRAVRGSQVHAASVMDGDIKDMSP